MQQSGGYGTGLVGAIIGVLFALLAFVTGFTAQHVIDAGPETAAHGSPH